MLEKKEHLEQVADEVRPTTGKEFEELRCLIMDHVDCGCTRDGCWLHKDEALECPGCGNPFDPECFEHHWCKDLEICTSCEGQGKGVSEECTDCCGLGVVEKGDQ